MSESFKGKSEGELHKRYNGECHTKRALVADAHPVMRYGLSGLLGEAGLEVVAESGCGEEALRLVEELQPELVVMGLNLEHDMDGVDLCREIKKLPMAPYVLVHAAYNLTEDICSCLLAGADGYLHKTSSRKAFVDTVHRVVGGERVWIPGEHSGDARSRLYPETSAASLTPKEREVLVLMLRRLTEREMATELFLSPETIRTHTKRVLKKLGLKSRKELLFS